MTNISHSAMTFLWHYIKCFKWQFLTLLICLFFWAINESLFPYFIKMMVDQAAVASHDLNLWQIFSIPIMGIALTWGMMEISVQIYGFTEVYLFPTFRAKMRKEVFDHVKKQSLEYFTRNLSGSIGTKIADIPKSSQYILENLLWYVIGVGFALTLSFIVLAQASFIFSGLMLIWCGAQVGVTLYYMSEINDKIKAHYESITNLNGETVDIILNASSMRLFARQDFETKRLQHYQDREIRKSIIAGLCLQKLSLIRGLISLCFIFINTYFLLKGWREQWLSAGDFPLVAMTSFNLMGLVWHMTISLVDMFQDIGHLNGALSILKSRHTVIDKPGATPLIVRKGEIEFQDVEFGHRQGDHLFKGLSLKINPSEKVGLVGFSGSGKTTLINLILREFDIAAGRILIDGQDISTVTQHSLRTQISVIPQETHLFHRSIMENIRYGRLDASDEEVIEAATKAHCHDFIVKLEEGYHTIVGERGLKLSGGQRQRLSIARAILKNAPILILDEATSALDSVTEKDIHDSLVELMQNRTTIIIAHRLSTLKMMDRIIVFDKGKIVEEGTQKQLLGKKGYFTRLWALQHEGFLPN
jgi:ATP-binding cassette subfamily B protein